MNNFKLDSDNALDEDFFGSLKQNKSTLQELFRDDALLPGDKQHQSLKYQRPKNVATSSNATSSTLMAKAVTAYKQGELQGKVGLALIQNPDNNCTIIMYKTKSNILATVKLQPEKILLYKQNKYWQFYNEESTYWSFSFDTAIDEEEFVEKLNIKSITYKESKENDHVIEKHIESTTEYVGNSKNKTLANASRETKNSLIKRMAKMGKPLPTLPFSNQQTATEFSDSSDTEVINTSLASTKMPSIAPRNNLNVNQELVPSVLGLSSVGSALYPVNHLESQYMQMLLTEQRTQGSELRMNMNKLENKIEKVLDKLELHDRSDGNKKNEKDDEILELEEKLLTLKKENRRLKQKLVEKPTEDSKENEIKRILYEFEEDFKKFNIDYKQDLKNVLIGLNNKLKESHNELQEKQQIITDTEQHLKGLVTESELHIRENGELKNEINLLNQRENELKQQLNEKEIEIINKKHEVLDLQNKLQEKNLEISKTSNDSLIKSIMNNLYMDIADKLNNTNIIHSEKILSLIGSSIKEQTLKSLQQTKLKNNLS